MSNKVIGPREIGLIKDISAPIFGSILATAVPQAAAAHLASHAGVVVSVKAGAIVGTKVVATKAICCKAAATAVAIGPIGWGIIATAAFGYALYKAYDEL